MGSEVTQLIKELAPTPDNLSSVHRTCGLRRKPTPKSCTLTSSAHSITQINKNLGEKKSHYLNKLGVSWTRWCMPVIAALRERQVGLWPTKRGQDSQGYSEKPCLQTELGV